MLLLALGEYFTLSNGNLHVCDIFIVRKLANSNTRQAYNESLIRFSSTGSKLLTHLTQAISP